MLQGLRSERRSTKLRQSVFGLSRYHRRLVCEPLEDRCLLSVAPLNVALISDGVAQAQQVRAAAAKDTIAIVYNSDAMTTNGLVDLLASVSAAHNGAPIGHLGIVAHGGPGELDLGKGDDLSLATMPSQAVALKRLRSVLTSDARVDLYACSVAAGASGKTFVDEFATVTGATVFASDNPVGTIPGSGFIWEYHTGPAITSKELFSSQESETIPRLAITYLPPPTLCTPPNGSTGQSTTPYLSWSSVSGAVVYASDEHVGSGEAGDFVWEYQTGHSAANVDLFPSENLESIANLLLAAPPTPTGLTPTAQGPHKIYVTWNSSSGASNYKLERSTSSSGPWTQIYYASGTSYADSGPQLLVNTRYYYHVCASNSSGDSAFSSAASAVTWVDVPAAPSGLSPSATGPHSISVTWNSSSGASNYKLERSTSSSGPWTQVYYASGTSYADSGPQLLVNTRYYYHVCASNSSGDSAFSSAASAVTWVDVPAAPSGLSPSATGPHSISVTWNSSSGASNYKLERSTSSSGPWTQVYYASGTSYADSGPQLLVNTRYYYHVCASNSSGDSAFSSAASAVTWVDVPAAPSGLSPSATGPHSISVTWNSSSGASNYKLERSTSSSGPWTQVYYASGTSYTDSGPQLLVNTQYYYHVCASNSSGDSAFSSAASAVTWVDVPAAPSGLSPSATGPHSISVTWNSSSGASNYKLERSTSSSGPWTQVYYASGTSYTDSGPQLLVNTQYFYHVCASNSSGDSAFSSAASAVTWVDVPAAPSGLSPSATGPHSISVTWNSSSGASNYKLERSTSSSGPWTQIYYASGMSYTDSGPQLLVNTRYYYHVCASNSSGDSAFSSAASAVTWVDVPAAPSGLSPSATGPHSISVTWNSSSGASNYKLERSTSSSGPWTQVYYASGTSYTDSGPQLLVNTQYFYHVCASNSSGDSAFSSAASAVTWVDVPAAPSGLSPSATGPHSISVTWNSSSGASNYKLERSTSSSGPWTQVYYASGTSYTDSGPQLLVNTRYYYHVCASNSSGDSAFSSAASAVTWVDVPAAPSGLSPSATGPHSISVTWNSSSGASNYKLERSTSSSGPWTQVYYASGTSYTDSGPQLLVNTQYFYHVCASNSSGDSAFSSAASAVTWVDVPAAPSGLSPSATGPHSISVTWNSSSGASNYKLERSTSSSGPWTQVYYASGTSYTDSGPQLLVNTRYYYHVCASNSSGDSAFSSAASAVTWVDVPAAPTLNDPLNGAVGVSTTPTFSWSSVSGADTYRIVVSTVQSELPSDPGYSGSPVPAHGLTWTNSTTSTLPSSALQAGTTYFWEVHGGRQGVGGYWSSYRSFTTLDIPTPVIDSASVSPTNLAPGGTLTVNWQTSGTVDHVQLYLTNPSGDQEETFSPTNLPPDGTYNWIIPTNKAAGDGYKVMVVAWASSTQNDPHVSAYTNTFNVTAGDAAPVFANVLLDGQDPASSFQRELGDYLAFSGSVSDDLGLAQITIMVTSPKVTDHQVNTYPVSGTSHSLSSYGFDTGNTTYAGVGGNYTVAIWARDTSGQATQQVWHFYVEPPEGQIGFDYPIGSSRYYTEANDGDGWYDTQDFGDHNSEYGYHLGEDWNMEGTVYGDKYEPVYAAANATVVYAQNAGSLWGNVVILRHQLADGTFVETLYGHLDSFSVSVDDTVTRRQQIGTVGDADGAWTPHLHFELRYANCPNWGAPGPGYSTTPQPLGWADPSDFIDAHRPSGDTAPVFTNALLDGQDPASSFQRELGDYLAFSGSVSDDLGLAQITIMVTSPKVTDHQVNTYPVSGTSHSLSSYGFDTGNTTYAGVGGNYTVAIWARDTSGQATQQVWHFYVEPQSATRVLGVDVSDARGVVDWDQVALTDKKFAFVKATEGEGFGSPDPIGEHALDSQYAYNALNAQQAGLIVGAYHYARPDMGNTAEDEASWFVSQASGIIGAGFLPPALDVEGEALMVPGATLSVWVDAWMDRVQVLTGVRPVLYASQGQLGYIDQNPSDTGLWVARYYVNGQADPQNGNPGDVSPWAASDWSVWQYMSVGSVPGISGNVDLDVFNGAYPELLTWINGTTDADPPVVTSASADNTTVGQGQPIRLSWMVTDNVAVDHVALYLYQNGQFVNTSVYGVPGGNIDGRIALGAENIPTSGSGLYDWTVFSTLPAGNYRIRVAAWDTAGNSSSGTLPSGETRYKWIDFSVDDTAPLPTLSINDVTLVEGDSGSKNLTFTVALSASSSQTVTVNYATSNGTATAGSDYTASSGILTFTSGQTSQQINVPILGDYAIEGNETFTMTLSGAANATVGMGTATGTIQNDDVAGTLALSSSTYSVNENAGTVTVTVNRNGGLASGVGVSYATSNGTATAGSDYTFSSGTLTFAGGATSMTFTVPITSGSVPEGNETFNVALSSATGGGTIGTPSSAIITIVDDDSETPTVTLMANDPNASEVGPDNGQYMVTRTGSTASALTVNYTIGGTATNGTDYTSLPGSAVIAAGAPFATINLVPLADTLIEGSETAILTLSSSAAYTVGSPASGTVIIGDVVSATHAALGYPKAGGSLTVNGSLSYPTDHTLLSLLWRPQLPSGWVLASVSGDGSPEIQSGEIVFTGSLTSHLLNFAYTATVPAGETGTKQIQNTFEYLLDGMVNPETGSATPSPLLVDPLSDYHTADYRDPRWTIDGTEVNRVLSYWRASGYHPDSLGVDGYAPGSGQPGNAPRHSADYRQTYWVIDGTEVNRVLSYWRAGGYHVDSQGVDGFAPGAPSAGIMPPVTTGQALASTVTSVAATPTVTHLATPSEYTAGGTLTITASIEYTDTLLSLLARPQLPAGWIFDQVTADGSVEVVGGEIVWLGTLPASPVNFQYLVHVPTGVNGDQDLRDEVETQFVGQVNPTSTNAAPNPLRLPSHSNASLSIADVSLTEGNTGTKDFTFTVTLSELSAHDVTAHYQTADGTATVADNDYQAASGTMTIPAGQTSGTITVKVVGDTMVEPHQKFYVNLSSPTNATLSNSQGAGTIQNDDIVPPIGPEISSVRVTPNPVQTAATVTATASDVNAGNNNVVAAEYFFDTPGQNGKGKAMAAADKKFNSPTEVITANLKSALAKLSQGSHTIYVHAKDATSKWGEFVSVSFIKDTLGPLTSNVTAVPSPTNTAPTLTATIDDTSTGGSVLVAAEYFIDRQGTSGKGTPIAAAFDSATQIVTATPEATTFSALKQGRHAIYVHGKDAVGNWGKLVSVTFVKDTLGPVTSSVKVAPSPANAAPTLTAKIDDKPKGGGILAAAEYFIDAPGTDGSGTAITVASNKVTQTVTGALDPAMFQNLGEGRHMVYVHAKDAAGNWGTAVSAAFVRDTLSPVASSVKVSPTPASKAPTVTATVDDTSNGSSTVVAAEYFIDASGTFGSGIAMTASDKRFNSPKENVRAVLAAKVFAALGSGTHTLYVHGKDAAGNWGDLQSATFEKSASAKAAAVASPPVGDANSSSKSASAAQAVDVEARDALFAALQAWRAPVSRSILSSGPARPSVPWLLDGGQ